MRVRLALLEPFPSSKVLLPLPEELKTIHELKKHILKSLSSVASLAGKTKDLTLEIDGFELLSGSGVDILQDGDIVSVKLAASSSKSTLAPITKKRKARLSEPQVALPKEVKKLKIANGLSSRAVSAPVPRKVPSVSPSEASSSSASSSRASSSSASSTPSSSAGSSSESSSDSVSDSGSEPERISTKPQNGILDSAKEKFPVLLNPKPLIQPQSAPGKGLSRTKNRNARKRKALAMKRLAAEEHDSLPSAIIPASTKASTPAAHPVEQPLISQIDDVVFAQYAEPRDMANRNKKKGFLRDMAGKQALKMVFNDSSTPSHGSPDIQQALNPPTPNGRPMSATPTKWKHILVVAPSEADELPSNVFVTSKEYNWRRNKQSMDESTNVSEKLEDHHQGDTSMVNEEEIRANGAEKMVEDVWQVAEDTFDSLSALASLEGLANDHLIAWKELELDLETFSPQMMLNLASVSLGDGLVKVKPLVRPVFVDEEADWNEGGDEAAAEPKPDFTLSNQDLLRSSGKYRIFRTA